MNSIFSTTSVLKIGVVIEYLIVQIFTQYFQVLFFTIFFKLYPDGNDFRRTGDDVETTGFNKKYQTYS